MPKPFTHKSWFELTLNTGHRINAQSIHICNTYEGMLMGVPNDEVNSTILGEAPTHYRRVFGEQPVYVLPPAIERWEEPHPADRSRQRVVAAMPCIEVAGLFVCISSKGQLSALIIVWHQDEAALSLSDAVRHRLVAIDWEAHAHDFEY
jgi:hypothetical protein